MLKALLLLLLPMLQVIVALAEKGDMSALQAYTGQSGGSLNYLQLLQQLMMNNPSGAVSLAKMVAKQSPPPVDVNTMADLFLQVRAAD
jgi:clathrin heavy chain